MEGGIYLLLGSNLGDRLKNLSEARNRIGSVLQSSAIYATAAWGKTEQPDFFNQAIEIKSVLDPEALLQRILDLEIDMGRVRTEKWGPRTIDIDILFYGDIVIDTKDLTIPHPEIQNRKFALEPLAEITNMTHPIFKKTIRVLLDECTDAGKVTRLPHQP